MSRSSPVLAALCLLGLALGAAHAAAPDGQAAARTWLAAADALDGAQSWKLAAPMFQEHVSLEQWQKMLAAVRSPLGALTTRNLATGKAATSLPGAPDGDYLVLQFQSAFEHKASAVETVTVAKQPDGSWRVAGYFIK